MQKLTMRSLLSDLAAEKNKTVLSWLLNDPIKAMDEVINHNLLLHQAIMENKFSLAKGLVKLGANVNEKNDDDATPLHLAAARGTASFCQFLLDHGADIDATDSQMAIPLYYALLHQKRNNELITLLSPSDCLLYIKNHEGVAPINLIFNIDSQKALTLVQEHSKFTSYEIIDFAWLLHQAIENNKPDYVEEFLKLGANINCEGPYKNTPLHLATSKGSTSCCKFLIDHGADADACNAREETPLHLAAQNGPLSLLYLLVESSHRIAGENYNKLNPLDIAVNNGNRAVIKYLENYYARAQKLPTLASVTLIDLHQKYLDKKAQAEKKLFIAAKKGDIKDVIEILNAGVADINKKNKIGYVPLDYAIAKRRTKIVLMLIKYGALVNCINPRYPGRPPLWMAIEKKYDKIALLLIENRADADFRGDHDRTPLHWAAINGLENVAEALVLKGADIQAKDQYGNFPRSFAPHFSCLHSA